MYWIGLVVFSLQKFAQECYVLGWSYKKHDLEMTCSDNFATEFYDSRPVVGRGYNIDTTCIFLENISFRKSA